MNANDFIQATVCELSQPVFDEYKDMLIGKYIDFAFIDQDAVTIDILAEKLYDLFVALELKSGRKFRRRLDSYWDELDDIVGPHIAKAPQAKKGETTPLAVPRARRYYELALKYKDLKKPSYTQLIDYFRIMMCLYTAVINDPGATIRDFDFSSDCLDPRRIIDALLAEEAQGISKRKRFDTSYRFGSGRCKVIITILLLWALMNEKIERENDHE